MESLVLSGNKFALHEILNNVQFIDNVAKFVPGLVLDISYFDLREEFKVVHCYRKIIDYDILYELPKYKSKNIRYKRMFLDKLINKLEGTNIPGNAFSLDRFSLLSFADYLIDMNYEKKISTLYLKFQEVVRPFD